MAYENRENRLQLPFLPSSQAITLPIPPNFSILQGKLILVGTVTIAGGTTNGTAVGEGGPINLIKRIRIIGNPANGSPYPGGYLVDVSARSLLRWAQLNHFGTMIGEQSGSVLGNGAAGTYPIYLSIPIYFADTTLRQQVATALYADPSAYASLQCQVVTGGPTDCFAGTDRVWTFNLQLQWADDRVDIVPSNPGVALFQEDHLVPIGAANTRLNDPALPQDGAFLSWTILAEQNQPAYALSDALLNRITVFGPTWSFDEFAQDIRQKMYDDEWVSPAVNAAGLYHIDMTNGILQNANPANGLLPQVNVNNPSGVYLDQLRVFTRRIYTVQAQGS
jgi:hypothetical protein